MTFQMLLSDLRTRLQLSVADGTFTGVQIASRVGVAQAHVSNFLNGRRGISPELADKLLEILGLDVEALVAEKSIRERAPFEAANHDHPLAVPIVSPREALSPVVQERNVRGVIYLPRHLSPGRKCETRQHWTRLIAIPGCQPEEILVIDRYLCDACPGRFAVVVQNSVQQGRLISDRYKTWFCPDDHSKPVCNNPTVIGLIVQTQHQTHIGRGTASSISASSAPLF